MADHVTTRPDRDTEAVRDEILRTRAEIDRTVAALGERLAPGRLIGDAWHRLRGEDTRPVGEVFRDHPLPFALMGLGIGWLAIEQATGRSVTRGHDGPVGPGTRAREKAAQVKQKAADAKEAAAELEDRARVAQHRARDGFQNLMEDHPVAVGAVAFGLGMLGAASARSTRAESRVMGGAADTLKDEARRVTRESREKARHVVEEAAHAATDEFERQSRGEAGPAHDAAEAARHSERRAGDATAG